jgi:hypothetical protein
MGTQFLELSLPTLNLSAVPGRSKEHGGTVASRELTPTWFQVRSMAIFQQARGAGVHSLSSASKEMWRKKLPALTVLLVSIAASAQRGTEAIGPTLKTTARLAVVDVVVTDAGGNPVRACVRKTSRFWKTASYKRKIPAHPCEADAGPLQTGLPPRLQRGG